MDALRKRAVSVASPPCACSRGGRGWPAWPLGAGGPRGGLLAAAPLAAPAWPWASAAALSGRVAARKGPCASCGTRCLWWLWRPLRRRRPWWPWWPLARWLWRPARGALLLLVPVPLSWSQIARFAWFPWRRVLEGWEGVQAKAMSTCGSMTATPEGAAFLLEGVIYSPSFPPLRRAFQVKTLTF